MMGLDLGAFILALISIAMNLVQWLCNVKRDPANDAPSIYKLPLSSESEAQNRKIKEMNDRLFGS